MSIQFSSLKNQTVCNIQVNSKNSSPLQANQKLAFGSAQDLEKLVGKQVKFNPKGLTIGYVDGVLKKQGINIGEVYKVLSTFTSRAQVFSDHGGLGRPAEVVKEYLIIENKEGTNIKTDLVENFKLVKLEKPVTQEVKRGTANEKPELFSFIKKLLPGN